MNMLHVDPVIAGTCNCYCSYFLNFVIYRAEVTQFLEDASTKKLIFFIEGRDLRVVQIFIYVLLSIKLYNKS